MGVQDDGCGADFSLTLTLSRTTKGLKSDEHSTRSLEELKYVATHPLIAETVR